MVISNNSENIQKIRISFKLLNSFLKGNFKNFTTNLPKDTEIIRVYDERMQNPDYETEVLVCIVKSKKFKKLEKNQLIPDFNLILKDI